MGTPSHNAVTLTSHRLCYYLSQMGEILPLLEEHSERYDLFMQFNSSLYVS